MKKSMNKIIVKDELEATYNEIIDYMNKKIEQRGVSLETSTIINREDVFFAIFTHVHFRIKYRPRSFLRVVWKSCNMILFLKIAADLVRFGFAHLDVWKWSKSMKCDGVFALYIERRQWLPVHSLCIFSLAAKKVKVHRVINWRITICYGHIYIVHGKNISFFLSTFTYEHLQIPTNVIIWNFFPLWVTNRSLTGKKKKVTQAWSKLCQNSAHWVKNVIHFVFVNYAFCVNN